MRFELGVGVEEVDCHCNVLLASLYRWTAEKADLGRHCCHVTGNSADLDLETTRRRR